MNELFNNSATADIIFRIQSPSSSSDYEYLYAQRSILTARSSYFAETLNTKQKKKTKKGKGQVGETKSTVDGAKEISVQRMRYRTFYSFVRWLYSGSIHFATPYFTAPYDHYEAQLVELDRENGATHCNPLEVYVCADRYGSDDLKRLVLKSLPQCLGGGLAFSLLFSPYALAYEDIKQCLLGYIKEHIAELKLSKDLVDLVLNRPTGLDMELDATMVGLRFRDDRAAQAWKDVLEILIGA
ncbi:hypothetical protein BT69DRAFT_1356569 [Atractiella rhizophila]|nr:hypothetical protein BT69DRAFT_1356569 [Atractiella rhizophila]